MFLVGTKKTTPLSYFLFIKNKMINEFSHLSYNIGNKLDKWDYY